MPRSVFILVYTHLFNPWHTNCVNDQWEVTFVKSNVTTSMDLTSKSSCKRQIHIFWKRCYRTKVYMWRILTFNSCLHSWRKSTFTKRRYTSEVDTSAPGLTSEEKRVSKNVFSARRWWVKLKSVRKNNHVSKEWHMMIKYRLFYRWAIISMKLYHRAR